MRRPNKKVEDLGRRVQRGLQVAGLQRDIKLTYDAAGGLKITLPGQMLYRTGETRIRPEAFALLENGTPRIEEYLADALRIRRTQFPDGHPETARPLILFGMFHLRQGHAGRAETYVREALELRRRFTPEGWRTASCASLLGECLLKQERVDEAEPLLTESYEALSRVLPAANPRLEEAKERLDALRRLREQEPPGGSSP